MIKTQSNGVINEIMVYLEADGSKFFLNHVNKIFFNSLSEFTW